MDAADKKKIIELAQGLGVTDDGIKELELFIDNEDYPALKKKFTFYTDLAIKKENEFFKIQQKIYDKEYTDTVKEIKEAEERDFDNLRKLEALEDALEEESVDDHYAALEAEIAKVNEDAINKLFGLKKKIAAQTEEYIIEGLKDKLK